MRKIITLAGFICFFLNITSAEESQLPSLTVGTIRDCSFASHYLSGLNQAIGKGIGIRNDHDTSLNVTIKYGVWRFKGDVIYTQKVSFILPPYKHALIIDPRIRIEHIRSILKIWTDGHLIFNKTREEIEDSTPWLRFNLF
ncbi:MAG: hypothetical protein H6492_02860 [Candidatus Paracaedibacteraceae bacterium]|nr:hypothetical protein [Candidatus Paracaedibacteraceae bacterium]